MNFTLKTITWLVRCTTAVALTIFAVTTWLATPAQAQDKPNTLVISGEDIWQANINADHRGKLSKRTMNFDQPLIQLGDAVGGASILTAQTPVGKAAATPKYTPAQINEMINNPLGELWMLFTQNDTTSYKGDALDFLGEDNKIFNTTTIMPVMPFQLTENWKWIFRPVVPLHYWNAPSVSQGTPTQYPGGTIPAKVDFDDKFGLGDIVLWNAFGTNEMTSPPNIYGFGVTTILDTATEDVFGTGKWSAGPLGLAFHIGPPGGWILGGIVQHWWSFAGDDDRSDVNMTNIQYVAYYRLNAETNIGFGGPNIIVNWEADSDNRWTVPIGLAVNTTTKIGPLPVKIGIEVYKYIVQPDLFGADWGLRLVFSPVIPKPAFSKRPFFRN